MFSMLLTRDEVRFLLQTLALVPSANSPWSGWEKGKITTAQKKKLLQPLLSGGALVADDSQAEGHRVNRLLTGALGVVAAPEGQLEILAVSGETQEKRTFLGYGTTWAGVSVNEDGSLTLNAPVSEPLIRNFVLDHLTPGTGWEKAKTYSQAEILALAAIVARYRAVGDQPFALEELTSTQAKSAAVGVFESIYGEQDLVPGLTALEKQGELKREGERYRPAEGLSDLIKLLAVGRIVQVARQDLTGKNPGLRVVTLFQGEEQVVVQQAIPAQPPVVSFKAVDAEELTLLLTLAVWSSDELAEHLERAKQPKPTKPSETKTESNPPAASVVPQPLVSTPEPEPTPAKGIPTAGGLGAACPNCGSELSPGARFCRGCGEATPEVEVHGCPECGQENSPEAKFCRHCGKEL